MKTLKVGLENTEGEYRSIGTEIIPQSPTSATGGTGYEIYLSEGGVSRFSFTITRGLREGLDDCTRERLGAV